MQKSQPQPQAFPLHPLIFAWTSPLSLCESTEGHLVSFLLLFSWRRRLRQSRCTCKVRLHQPFFPSCSLIGGQRFPFVRVPLLLLAGNAPAWRRGIEKELPALLGRKA